MRKITSIFGVFLLLLAFAPSAFSQMNISGKVTDEKGNAMTGVPVIAKKTTVGAITDLNGNYKITVPGNSGTLMFSFLGYKTVEKAVSSSADNVNVTMSPSQNSLDEVVISGLASNVQRRNLANSVDKISARELSGVTTQQTMDRALYGKFKGANITSNSGSPGGGVAVKLRGITSITGSSQPLYIVDGIYVDNSEIAAGLNSVSQAAAGGSASNQDNPSNRIH